MGSLDFLNMLGGAAGSSLYDSLRQQQAYNNDLAGQLMEREINSHKSLLDAKRAILENRPKTPQGRKPRTFREELQAETDEWLRDN